MAPRGPGWPRVAAAGGPRCGCVGRRAAAAGGRVPTLAVRGARARAAVWCGVPGRCRICLCEAGGRRPAGPGADGRAAGRRLLAAQRQCWRCAGRVRAAARSRGPGLRRARRAGRYTWVRLCLRAAVGRAAVGHVCSRHAHAPACPCPVCSWLRACASCVWACMSRARAVRVRAGTSCSTWCEQAHDAGITRCKARMLREPWPWFP